MINNQLRQLPSVDRLLTRSDVQQMIGSFGRPLVVDGLRHVLDRARQTIVSGQDAPQDEQLVNEANLHLQRLISPTLQPVINGTGVIIHTNLGRAPLSTAAVQAIVEAARQYSNLEYDLAAGERGSRTVHCESLLKLLTGAEAALVVNNNAAAILLVLTALCQDREVVISRGQLVEIGGGFRVPEVLAQSGARLVEVGTTNKTHLRDYQKALTEETAAILVAHHSNFKIVGFSSQPSLVELAELADHARILLLYDQGSGALKDTSAFGLDPEPLVQQALVDGVDLVTFSADKLVGGPQAGIIVGKEKLLERVKSHPLARAVRVDKLCLAGLSATLSDYLRDAADAEVPIWKMMSYTVDELRWRADSWASVLNNSGFTADVIAEESTVGGGSLPGTTLPTMALAIKVSDAVKMEKALRSSEPPLITRVSGGRVLIDPRTVLPEQDPLVSETLLEALAVVGRD